LSHEAAYKLCDDEVELFTSLQLVRVSYQTWSAWWAKGTLWVDFDSGSGQLRLNQPLRDVRTAHTSP